MAAPLNYKKNINIFPYNFSSLNAVQTEKSLKNIHDEKIRQIIRHISHFCWANQMPMKSQKIKKIGQKI